MNKFITIPYLQEKRLLFLSHICETKTEIYFIICTKCQFKAGSVYLVTNYHIGNGFSGFCRKKIAQFCPKFYKCQFLVPYFATRCGCAINQVSYEKNSLGVPIDNFYSINCFLVME